MVINPRNLRILTVSYLIFCFISGLVFSGYYGMDQADCFTSKRAYENPDLPTLSSIEKGLPVLFSVKGSFELSAFSWTPLQYLEILFFFSEKINSRLRC
jgi:hypothetical protein